MVTTAETRKMATKNEGYMHQDAAASSNLWQPTDGLTSVYNAVDHPIF